MIKIFKDNDAKREFVKFYDELAPEGQELFGKALRKRADEKMTRLDDIDDFYITRSDVIAIFTQLVQDGRIYGTR
jgi:hypothetical protein